MGWAWSKWEPLRGRRGSVHIGNPSPPAAPGAHDPPKKKRRQNRRHLVNEGQTLVWGDWHPSGLLVRHHLATADAQTKSFEIITVASMDYTKDRPRENHGMDYNICQVTSAQTLQVAKRHGHFVRLRRLSLALFMFHVSVVPLSLFIFFTLTCLFHSLSLSLSLSLCVTPLPCIMNLDPVPVVWASILG